jgi:hypothetical protein
MLAQFSLAIAVLRESIPHLLRMSDVIGEFGRLPSHLTPNKRAVLLRKADEYRALSSLYEGASRRLSKYRDLCLSRQANDKMLREMAAYTRFVQGQIASAEDDARWVLTYLRSAG